MMTERRERIYSLPEWQMIDFLRMYDRVPEMIAVPTAAGLPKDARILHCWPDQSRRAIQILVESATFDVVPDGACAPDGWPLTLELRTFQLYPPATLTVPKLTDEAVEKLRNELQDGFRRSYEWSILGTELEPSGELQPDGATEPPEASVGLLNRDELLQLRDQINARLYDLERQPAM